MLSAHLIPAMIAKMPSALGAWLIGILTLFLAVLAWWQRKRIRDTHRQIAHSQSEHLHLLKSLEELNAKLEDQVQQRTRTVESSLTALRQEIAERQQVQEHLQRQSEFERLLAVTSTDFLNVRPDQCHDLIQRSLASLQDFLSIDAIAICEFSEDELAISLISESCRDGKPHFKVDFKAHVARKISELPARHYWKLPLKGKTIALADTQNEAFIDSSDERAFFESRQIKASLQEPLRVENSVLGFIALHNLTNTLPWDPSLVAQIELVAQVYANTLYRKHTDDEIARLQGFGVLISKVSGNFVDLPAAEIGCAIETSLRQLGEFIGATRCSIYQVSEQLTSIQSVYKWIAPNASPEIQEANRLTLSYYPWFQQCYREGTPIAMSSIYDIPSYAAPERSLVSKLRAKSFLVMPMRLAGRPIGHVGFSMDTPNYPWSKDLIEQTRLVAELFANALERQRKERDLAASEMRYRTIVEDQTEWILRWRPDGTRIFVNQSYCERFGQSANALLGTNFLHEARPEDRDRIQRQIKALTPEHSVTTALHEGRKLDGSTSWEHWTDRAFFDHNGRLIEIQSVAFDMTEQRLAEQRAVTLQRDFQQALIDNQEAERARIARELHDELGQSLTALRMHTRAMQKRLESNQPDILATFDTSLEGMIGLVDTTIPEVRRICAELRPSLLDNLGLVAAMEWQLDKLQQNTGIRCTKNFLMNELPTHQKRDIAMFRIFQELLTNVTRHADATEVWVTVHLNDANQLILEVRDNGCGVTKQDIEETTHFGLLGIRERAASIGGTVEITGTAHSGTTAIVTIDAPDLAKS